MSKTVIHLIIAWAIALTLLACMIAFVPVFSGGVPETILWLFTVIPLVLGSIGYIKKRGL